MSIKGYITPDNIYYESEIQLNDVDIEVPVRPNNQHIWTGKSWSVDRRKPRFDKARLANSPDPGYHLQRADYSEGENQVSQQQQKQGVFENISWKDLITILYFLAGLAGMWIHMSERTLILEQKLAQQEKDYIALKENVKDADAKLEAGIKVLNNQANELSLIILRKSSQ